MATTKPTHTTNFPASQPPGGHPPRRAPRLASDIGMLLVCLIWGLNFSITKLALDQIPPLPFTAIRFIAASLLLWLVLRVVEGPVQLPPGALRTLALLGLLGNTCYQLTFTVGLDRTAATNSALILST